MVEREQTGGLGELLFPSVWSRPGAEKMITDIDKALDRIGRRAGFPVTVHEDGRWTTEVRAHRFRHTYCAARIQTLDRGAPVAIYTVARELGHNSTKLIEDHYGHLHDRALLGGSEAVEFRIETYRDRLGERLRAFDREPSSNNAEGRGRVTKPVTNRADAG